MNDKTSVLVSVSENVAKFVGENSLASSSGSYQVDPDHQSVFNCDGSSASITNEAANIFESSATAGLSKEQNLTFSTFSATLPVPFSLTEIYDNIGSSMNSTRDYYYWLKSFADPRVEGWPLMSSPMPTLIAFFAYLVMANYGPTLMKSRKPLELRWLLVIYNLCLAVLNFWIVCEICYCSYKLRYNSLCQLVTITYNPYVMRIANGVWWYFASKGIEFADTLFFVLRKKDRQLTFLHKYHHSSMFLVWWIAARFVPGGSAIIPVVVNSLVHVIMYSYYGLSAVGPSMQKYLWWKRHLTRIQLIQFFVGVSIGIRLITSGCQFTRWMQYVFSGYAFSFIILFGNFYLHEYIKGRKSQDSDKAKRQ